MAAANYRLCDKCGAKTFYDSDVDYEDSNLGAMAALCKDCAQTHEITIAKRGGVAELRAALEGIVQLLTKPKTDPLRDIARVVGAIGIARAALAATEGSEP